MGNQTKGLGASQRNQDRRRYVEANNRWGRTDLVGRTYVGDH